MSNENQTIPFLNNPESKFFNQPCTPETKWVNRVTKATLLHTDGTQSEIKLIAPIYTKWSDPSEISFGYISEYINELTRHFISIVGYQIRTGSIDINGIEHYGAEYPPFEIPVGKIYFDGEWCTPEEIKKREWDELMKGRK